MPPTEGSAQVAGFDVVEESLEVRKRVGYLPETVPLYTDMTTLEYLTFMADLRKLPEAADRAYETLELVGMDSRANSYISSLSKGMRQRIGLAQALIHQPEVLILDEPTIGLDPAQVVEVRNLIRDMGKQRTVLLSTHILSEAQQICDRVSDHQQGPNHCRGYAPEPAIQAGGFGAGKPACPRRCRRAGTQVVQKVKGVRNVSTQR